MDTSYKHMHNIASIRFAAALAFAVTAPLLAQSPTAIKAKIKAKPALRASSSLPPTQPTAIALPPTPPTPSQLPPAHAQVVYTGGSLSVSANNSSLNQILREISHETGIKISGGVAEERVFGQYGPDAPAQVLAALLDGTGVNMVLLHSDGTTPAQLILTSRQGGPTPPNPNAAVFEEKEEREARTAARAAPPAQPAEPTPAQPEPLHPPVTAPGANGVNGASPDATSGQPESPNGVKTPQQIYEQLQRLRQPQPQTPQ
jgi:hypothetical protein